LLGRRVVGERAAFWGALLLGLAPGFVSMGRLLILDGLLALWVTLSLFAGFEAVRGGRLRWGWWLLAAVACGLGVLTKGPVAVVLLVPPLWLHRRLTRAACPIPWGARAVFLGVFLAVALPWYVAICLRLPEFARYFLWQHNVVRFLSPFDHLRPIWFYGPVLMAGLLPGSLLAISFARFLLSGSPDAAAKRSPELGFVLLAGGWCVLFFSLSGCKLPTYVLPAFPMLALALGSYLTGSTWLRLRTPWPRLSASASFAVLCLGHNWLLPWYADYRAPGGQLAELRDYCGDKQTPVVCYPRNCDSAAFYVGRDDLRGYRGKQTNNLLLFLQEHPRTILLLTHRHSLQNLRYALTPDLHVVEVKHFGLRCLPGLSEPLMQRAASLMGETSLGLCDLAVVERRPVRNGE
jgi:hypothetical protein